VIWTTTPWTIPGNRAVAYSSKITYLLFEVKSAPADNWVQLGQRFVIAANLADSFKAAARIEKWKQLRVVNPADILELRHPLFRQGYTGYDFKVPLLEGEHVTEDTGTGFVHTAPGHGADDFDIWTASTRHLQSLSIDPAVPDTVGPD